jgi:hypothetical protein
VGISSREKSPTLTIDAMILPCTIHGVILDSFVQYSNELKSLQTDRRAQAGDLVGWISGTANTGFFGPFRLLRDVKNGIAYCACDKPAPSAMIILKSLPLTDKGSPCQLLSMDRSPAYARCSEGLTICARPTTTGSSSSTLMFARQTAATRK